MKRKIIARMAIVLIAILLWGCGKDNTTEPSTEKEDGMSPTQTPTQSSMQTPEPPAVEDERDWYVEDGTLYISKIYYSICRLAKNEYVYETPWTSYPGEIERLHVDAKMVFMEEYHGEPAAPNVDARNHLGLFLGDNNIKIAEVRIDMGEVEDASFMFSGCSSLVSANVELSGGKLKYAAYLFAEDSKLESASVTIQSGNIKEVQSMFFHCSALTNVSTSISGEIERCSKMYQGCKSLQSVSVPFAINSDTAFLDMFFECSALKRVDFESVTVTKGGSAFFDNDNSIASYEFANGWKVDVENLANPIGDSIHDTIIIPVGGKGAMFEFVVYSKPRPEWYREYIEKLHRLDDFTLISADSVLDVYFSGGGSDPGEELSAKDVIEACAAAIAEMDKEAGKGKFAALKETYDKISGMKDNSEKIIELIKKIP